MPDDLPDLTHRWHQPRPADDPTWWECAAGCLSGHRGLPPSTLCPARVIAYADEQRAAGAAAERARIVEWLRTGPDRGRGTAAWDEAIAPIRAELADAIERGAGRTT